MSTFYDCIPCLIRQSLDAVRRVTPDKQIHERILRDILKATSEMDMALPPAAIGKMVHRRIRELCCSDDPYRESKERFNRLALQLYPFLEERVKHSLDPWETAVRLAIAGNLMDVSVKSNLREDQVCAAIEECLKERLYGDLQRFADAVAHAHDILYLADNAGEIVLDRLLIEQMPLDKVTLAVRGAPVINDATRLDAEVAGLTRIVRVIDNGSDAPGTLLHDCSAGFRSHFNDADLVIAKGQGNYETLIGLSKQIYFLVRVKCPVVARDLGRPVGSLVLHPSGSGHALH
ncbi:MAG: DUF89 family protein [Acidobacteria bacterium]|nr:DUF89 family protein [Acidobacteriota bacterium]